MSHELPMSQEISQDDLWFLYLFRLAWSNCPTRLATVRAHLAREPGHAAGQVAGWALRRAVSVGQKGCRRGLSVDQSLAPSADERRILRIAGHLRAGAWEGALAEARWLCRGISAEDFVQAMAPAAGLGAGYGRRRRNRAATSSA